MNILIRDARPEDADQIIEVFSKTWLATYPNEKYGITREDIESIVQKWALPEEKEKMKELLANLGKNHKRIVASADGKMVGVCWLWIREKYNQLKAIYILPEYQNKGIGKSFWKEAVNFFDPNKDIVLNIAVYNAPAIAFYKKLGFVETGRQVTDEQARLKSGSIIPETEMIIKRGWKQN